MRKNLLFMVALASLTAQVWAQEPTKVGSEKDIKDEATSFVFSEAELDEDGTASADIIQISSSSNVYTSNISYTFSPMWFRFRALDQRYNDIFMNGVNVNSAESGSFNFGPNLGGMNDAYNKSNEFTLPFETATYGLPSLGGSTSYNFRASNYAAGNKVTLSGANRNYTLRGMYSFGTGVRPNGWAFFGTVGYRWSNPHTAYIKGMFYNSLSYFLSAEKRLDERHTINIATWGTPTERGQAGISTDEAYWLANSYQYNPYWGYQDGKIRNSRVITAYEPTALLTWDFKIKENLKLTTSLLGKYAMESRTSLQYNNASNPKPDYWKNFPSYYYDVWGLTDGSNNDINAWQNAYDFWTASEDNRQIQWDELYYANQGQNRAGKDAAYYIQARHNNHLAMHLGSTLNWDIDRFQKLQGGIQLAHNTGYHYKTLDDMLGAENMHNINNYAIGTYAATANEVQYDLSRPNANLGQGDRYGYDYNIVVQKATAWAEYILDRGIAHSFVSGKIGATQMWRDGKMQNGIFADNSLGKSETAYFLDGGVKGGTNLNLGKGNVIGLGVSYITRAPAAGGYGVGAFQAPEMNNNFISGLKVEKIFAAEVGYALTTSWLRANLTAYFMRGHDMNEWQSFYYDDVNSYTYVGITGIKKAYYGVELGAKFKINSQFSIDVLGSMGDAKNINNAHVSYLLSTKGTMTSEKIYNKGMREAATPLTVASIGLNYNVSGWWFNLKGNYYDRIYLNYAPSLRYESTLIRMGAVDNDGSLIVPEQAEGHGGFMLDGSIGHQFRVAGHPLSVNLMLTNILNNRKLVNRGFEQSRSSYTTDQSTGEKSSVRTYNFQQFPFKSYVQGFNCMLNLNYRF